MRPKRMRTYRPMLEGLEMRLVPSTLSVSPLLASPDVALSQARLSSDGAAGSPGGFSPAQISQAYGFNQITFDNGTVQGNGSGQTIAIIDAYDQPNIASDLATFDSTFGLPAPPSFVKVNETGGTAYPGANTNWGLEISLDVEWAHAIAPAANILLVEANSATYSDLFTAVDYARSQPGVAVVSMSWGGGEWSGENAYDSNFTTPAGHSGVTFVASTGDSGSAGAPEYPSASPNVLAVGGTQLSTDSLGNYLSETGWSGSGGGISADESQPAYQKGVVTQSTTMRTVPDVAYNASGGSPYAIYDTSYGGWVEVYGTSAGAPQWSALVAIADQGRALAGQSSLNGPSQTLPMLYQLPGSDFHDITSGSNGAYSAGPGYDLVTGIGTPLANLIVPALAGPTSGGPTVVTPAQATPSSVTGTTTSLSVLGNDPAGASSLTYTWSVTSAPAGAAAPGFSANGTNAAQISTATFHEAGNYTFQVTLADPSGLTAVSSVTVTVNQTLTSLTVAPGTATLADGASQQFAAAGMDQFGYAMQPGFTWTLAGGSLGSINSSGMYAAPSSGTGSATVQATSGSMTGTATVTVTVLPPVITQPASSNQNPVTGTQAQLQVQASDPEGAILSYAWSVTSEPGGATAPTFNNANSNITNVAFSQAGSYTFAVTVTDSLGLTASSSVTVTVNQTLMSISVSPGSVTLADKGQQQFQATGLDQFGQKMAAQPNNDVWSIAAGGVGSINNSGQYTAPNSGIGSATVQAMSGGIAGTATVTVQALAPVITQPASSNQNPVTNTQTQLQVQASDPQGANLTYAWSVTSEPAGATVPAFNNANNNNTNVTFFQAGSYTFAVTVTDSIGLSAKSSVTVSVVQTLTGLSVTPANVSVVNGATQQFTAAAVDQFGKAMGSQPSFTWQVNGGASTISATGLFTAHGTGNDQVKVSAGGQNAQANATVISTPTTPVITQPASANQNPVTGTGTQLQVNATDPDGANPTYAWSVSSQPAGATPPAFNNATSNQTNVTFYQAGSYSFTVTVSDPSGLFTTSSVAVTVVQTLTSLSVTPGNVTLANGATQQFTATALDQFGTAIASPPAFTWQVNGGGGTINSTGLYTAPASGTGNFQVKVSANGKNAQANVTVTTAPARLPNLIAKASVQNGSDQVQLQWNSNSNNQTGFVVERSADGGVTWITGYRRAAPAIPTMTPTGRSAVEPPIPIGSMRTTRSACSRSSIWPR